MRDRHSSDSTGPSNSELPLLDSAMRGGMTMLRTPIWLFDIERMRTVWANNSAVELWQGESLDELLSRDFSRDISTTNITRLHEYSRRLRRGETIVDMWNFYPKGVPTPVECSCRGVFDEHGRELMLVEGVAVGNGYLTPDVLRATEAMRYSPVIALQFSHDSKLLFSNPAAERTFGAALEELGHYADLLLDPEQGRELWRQVLNGDLVRRRVEVYTSQGPRWHRIDLINVEDPVSGEGSVLVKQLDVSELMEVEAELRQSEERYRRLFTRNKAVALLIDPERGQIVDANEAAASYYGYRTEQLRRMLISEINILKPEEVKAEMTRAREEQRNHFFFLHRLASGEVRDVEVHSGPIEIDGRELLYSIVHDITERRAAEQALQKEREYLKTVLENTPYGFALIQGLDDSPFLYINPAFSDITGHTRHTTATVNEWLEKSLPDEEERRAVEEQWRAFLEGGEETAEFTLVAQHFHGDQRSLTLRVTKVGDGRHIIFVHDVTALKRYEMNLRLLSSALEHSGSSVIITDPHGRIEYVNPRFTEITGYNEEEVQGKTPAVLRHPETADEVYQSLWGTISRGLEWRGELRNLRRDGTEYWSLLAISPIKDRWGDIVHFVGVSEDVSELKLAHQEAERLSLYDSLTGLANRRLFSDRIEQAIKSAKRHGERSALLYLDLDHFKDVNDTLGHDHGDQLLREVAARLSANVRDEDTVARVGGDEFSILLPQIEHSEDASRVAQKIMNALAAPVEIAGVEFTPEGSIGITLLPEDGTDVETLQKNADLAMYSAKSSGRNNFQFFTEELNQALITRLEIERDLRRALEQDEFTLEYQPQVRLRNGEICGVEALVRWEHPERGRVMPDEFIQVAEDSGLIVPLGSWVLRNACIELQRLHESGCDTLWVTVNISAKQFRKFNLVDEVRDVLAETGLNPLFLELEVTESALMEDLEHSIQVLQELKRLGVLIAIDDFGTGYSSLSYLKRFPADMLKIDRSFIADTPHDINDVEIVAAIIAMGLNLELKVVAEGIENAEQAKFLLNNNCEMGQGNYFSAPLSMEQLLAFLHRNERCRLESPDEGMSRS